MSTRNLAHAVRVSYNMHPFLVQCVKELQPDDYVPRIAFAECYLGKYATVSIFPTDVLFSDEMNRYLE